MTVIIFGMVGYLSKFLFISKVLLAFKSLHSQ